MKDDKKKSFTTHSVPKTGTNQTMDHHLTPRTSKSLEGFTQKKYTRHPKAKGQVEGFNKLMNKTPSIARAQGIDLQAATDNMLQAYREMPHPPTKTALYELLPNREISTRLDHYPTERSN